MTAANDALGVDGRLVFETRDPAFRGWEEWTREKSFTVKQTTSGDVADSTLRFRTIDELEPSLSRTGFVINEMRDAPDRPSQEFIVIA